MRFLFFFILMNVTLLVMAQKTNELWNFHIQAEKTLDSWKQEFQRAAEDLENIKVQYHNLNLSSFLSTKAQDGYYAYFLLDEKVIKVYYFSISNNCSYLISSLEENIIGKNWGTLCFQIFRRTYPVLIEVKDGRGQGSSDSGIMESQGYYLENFLLGNTANNQKITVAYLDEEEEEIGFQEQGFIDGKYRRAWLDRLGQISLKKTIKFPENSEQFIVTFYYGWSNQIPENIYTYSVEEFQELQLRRTLPITILVSHKRKFYQTLVIQTFVPFGDEVIIPQKILQLEADTPIIGMELKGQELQKLHLNRMVAKVELKALNNEDKDLNTPEEGAGRIEIFRDDGSRVIYRGRSSFRPNRIPNVAIEAGEYIFSYKPFYSQKYIQQRRNIIVGQDTTVTFRPYKRIPYIFYEFQNSVYSSLGNSFSTEEIDYRIRSLDTLTQFLDLLEQQKIWDQVGENFLNTLIEVYEQYESQIWEQIPPEHPHHITFYFDMAEIYWRRSNFSQKEKSLEKSLQLLMGDNTTFSEFCKTWYFKDGRCMDIKTFSQNLLKEKPGLLSKVRTKWDRYRIIHSLGAILLSYYKNNYLDISDDTCNTFCATALTLALGFKMKDERTRALGEEHPGLDYNIAQMIAEFLSLTKQRETNSQGWTAQQKMLIGTYLNDSESKHSLYSALSFLEALGEEFKRSERFELQIISSQTKEEITYNCQTTRRQELENFLNEILRKWKK